MLRGEKGRRLVAAMPPDRVLTETDGPLARGPGRVPLFPWDVQEAERTIAGLWGTSVAAVRRQLLANLRRLATARG